VDTKALNVEVSSVSVPAHLKQNRNKTVGLFYFNRSHTFGIKQKTLKTAVKRFSV